MRTWPDEKPLSAAWRAFWLLLPWMAAAWWPSMVLGDPVGAVLGAREDDHALERRIGEQRIQFAALGLRAGEDDPLLDAAHGCRGRGRLDPHGIVEQGLGQFGDLRRHGGREHRRLPARADGGGDLLDRMDEAHVEHAVGLVEDEPAGFVEPDLAVVHQVLEPARGGDDHVDALGQLLDLGVARYAAQHQHGREPHAVGQLAQHLVDLHREFAGGREDQGPRGHRAGPAVEAGNAGQDRQAEGRRLAGTGLGDTDEVAARELLRNGLGLDGGGNGEAGFGQRSDERSRQAEFRKILCQDESLVWRTPDQAARASPRRFWRGRIQIMQRRDRE